MHDVAVGTHQTRLPLDELAANSHGEAQNAWLMLTKSIASVKPTPNMSKSTRFMRPILLQGSSFVKQTYMLVCK